MNLKKLSATIFACVFFAQLTSAQSNSSSLSNGNGGFGGILYDISPMMGTTGIVQGGGGAYLRNNFFIGGYGMGLVTNHYKALNYKHPDDNSVNGWNYGGDPVQFSYGGLWLGKIFPLKNELSLSASGMFGWGSAGWKPVMSDRRRQKLYRIEENIFVMQPRVVATYQPLRWMRLEAGLSYRAVFTSNKQFLDVSGPGAPRFRNFFESGDFSAPSFSFGIMFGAF
ncbi:MAG: hypothetical protein IPM52_12245 [Bacteroidetes bacterium]|nr:hypothetical protein [Bacteroidota bacterium]